MPRLPTSLLRRARSIDPLLPLLLRTCRDLPSARNELRWLREHAAALETQRHDTLNATPPSISSTLYKLCVARSCGKPLQYILSSQPFGEVDIICRPGVLIPRPETETYTTHLGSLLLSHLPHTAKTNPSTLRILDLCTGTGCIPLALHALLAPSVPSLQILGIDISHTALSLARKNLAHNIRCGHLLPSARKQVRFQHGDVLRGKHGLGLELPERGAERWDVLISNPPYISPRGFEREAERSVRNWEPRLALVPPPPPTAPTIGRDGEGEEAAGDTFYTSLLSIARAVDAKILLMEVAGTAQARRVVETVSATEDAKHGERGWEGVEIWHDDLHGTGGEGEGSIETEARDWKEMETGNTHEKQRLRVRVVGTGHARAVLCFRGEGGKWLGRA